MKTARNPETIHRPLAAYSHQIEVGGPQRWLVLSGQLGQMPDDTIPEDSVEQLNVALANVRRNLEAARMRVEDIIKMTIYFVGEVDVHARRAALADWLAGHEPCLTVLFVAALATPQLRVEVDVWASHG